MKRFFFLTIVLAALLNVSAESCEVPDTVMAAIEQLRSRCEWASQVPAREGILSPNIVKELATTHPFSLAKIAEYWDAKATRELTSTLEYLSSKAHREKVDPSHELEMQYGLYYLENQSAIQEMIDLLRTSRFAKEI